jgi:peptide/nickel transport system permease protein
VVFVAAQVLPGDVARRILGPFADQASVDALNAQLGTDRSLVVQYWDWISSFVTGDLGESVDNRPVGDVIGDPLVASAASSRR